MVDYDGLAAMKELWDGDFPHVEGARCLNVRHAARACRMCVEACPADVISVPADKDPGQAPVVLDEAACARCGLCLNVCPTQVFVQAELPEVSLLQRVVRTSTPAVELACPRKESPDLSRVSEASVVQTPRCLAAISVPALLDLAMTGKSVWLNDSLCHTCPIGEAQRGIQHAITVANRWLQVMGSATTIRSYLTAAEELSDEPLPGPVEGSSLLMTRRGFFRSLTRRPERVAPPASSEDNHEFQHHISAQRQHLAAALAQLSPRPAARVPTAGLPINDLAVSDACTACALCTALCPTEALSWVSDEQYYVLNFSAALCLGEDCSLCVIGCPTHAVRFGQEVMADELLSTQPRPVRAGRLGPCARCGALTEVPMATGETGKQPLCYRCQAEVVGSH